MRVDLYLAREGYAASRTLAQKLIACGAVTLDGRVLSRASEDIPEGTHTVCVAETEETRYVGRGGLKLEAALDAFGVTVEGATVADIGASTGGFTHCLLERGAARVFAVDAGHDQLHPRLRADARVRVAEGVNARYLTPQDLVSLEADIGGEASFDGLCDGCVMDVSFISQTLLHPALASIRRPGGWFISLIKPQFELERRHLDKRGVVREEKHRAAALARVLESARACGFIHVATIPSPIEGGDGNRELLACFRRESHN